MSGTDIDLAVLWELLQEEGEKHTLQTLAELAIGEATPAALSAMEQCLQADRLYFREKKGAYAARSTASVEESIRQRELGEQRARRRERVVASLQAARQGAPLEADELASELRLLEGFAVHGDEHGQAKEAVELLEAVSGPAGFPAWHSAFRLLVDLGVFAEDEDLDLRRHGVALGFGEACLAEVGELLRSPEAWRSEERRDRRDQLTLTIDDEGTVEVDDALSIVALEDGGCRVEVHIADPAALILLGGAVDQAACRRGTSHYLPDQMIPMLPPAVASDLASLDEALERPALSFGFDLSAAGRIQDFEPFLSTVRVDRRLSYEEADDLLGQSCAVGRALSRLQGLSEQLSRERHRAGAMTLNAPEFKLKVAEDGAVSVWPVDMLAPSRSLVAEWMIQVGYHAAIWLESQGIPALYRCQEAPDAEWDLPEGGGVDFVTFFALVRRMRRASLGTQPGLHAGLGVQPYVQVTSPMRRYGDLLLHRQIRAQLLGEEPPYSLDQMVELGARVAMAGERSQLLERSRRRYWSLRYLKSRQGEVEEAVVVGTEGPRRARVVLCNLGVQQGVSLRPRPEVGERIAMKVDSVSPILDELVLIPASSEEGVRQSDGSARSSR